MFGRPEAATAGKLFVVAAGEQQALTYAAPLGHKDIRLALAAAEELQVPLPFAGVLRDRFLTLLAHGDDNLDWSAIGKLAAADAGMPQRAPRRHRS